jgi:hypothetical protein
MVMKLVVEVNHIKLISAQKCVSTSLSTMPDQICYVAYFLSATMASRHENDNGLIAARKPTRRDAISHAPALTLPATHGQQLLSRLLSRSSSCSNLLSLLLEGVSCMEDSSTLLVYRDELRKRSRRRAEALRRKHNTATQSPLALTSTREI